MFKILLVSSSLMLLLLINFPSDDITHNTVTDFSAAQVNFSDSTVGSLIGDLNFSSSSSGTFHLSIPAYSADQDGDNERRHGVVQSSREGAAAAVDVDMAAPDGNDFDGLHGDRGERAEGDQGVHAH